MGNQMATLEHRHNLVTLGMDGWDVRGDPSVAVNVKGLGLTLYGYYSMNGEVGIAHSDLFHLSDVVVRNARHSLHRLIATNQMMLKSARMGSLQDQNTQA